MMVLVAVSEHPMHPPPLAGNRHEPQPNVAPRDPPSPNKYRPKTPLELVEQFEVGDQEITTHRHHHVSNDQDHVVDLDDITIFLGHLI